MFSRAKRFLVASAIQHLPEEGQDRQHDTAAAGDTSRPPELSATRKACERVDSMDVAHYYYYYAAESR